MFPFDDVIMHSRHSLAQKVSYILVVTFSFFPMSSFTASTIIFLAISEKFQINRDLSIPKIQIFKKNDLEYPRLRSWVGLYDMSYKTWCAKSWKKIFGKIQIFETHLLNLVDKMCKYEMDLANIEDNTEWTRFCRQTDRQTDRRTDRHTYEWTDEVKPVYPLQLCWSNRQSNSPGLRI